MSEESQQVEYYSREFLEWLRLNCRTQIGQKNKLFDIYWVLIKDLDPWDELSNTLYTLDEIHQCWFESLEIPEQSDFKWGGKEITFDRLKKKVADIEKKRKKK